METLPAAAEDVCRPAVTAVPRAEAGAAPRTLKDSWTYRWRIAISVASLCLFGGLALLFEQPLPEGTAFDHVLDGFGWALAVAGVSLRLWAALCIGGRKTHQLVDEGPYSLCRNPLYVGTFLLAVAPMLIIKSVVFSLSLVAPVLVYLFGVVPSEEEKLTQRLGEPYLDYCRRVPRWWPRFSGFRRGVPREGLGSKSFRLELLRSAYWICLPAIAEAIAYLRTLLAAAG